MAVDTPAPVTKHIAQANAAVRLQLPFGDTADFDEARRGFVGSLSERTALDELVSGAVTIEAIMASGRLAIDGDQAKFIELLGLLDPPDPGFAIVTP